MTEMRNPTISRNAPEHAASLVDIVRPNDDSLLSLKS